MSTRPIGRRIAVTAAVIAMLLGVLVAPAGAAKPPGRGKPQPASTALSTEAHLQPTFTWVCWFDWCILGPAGPQAAGWHVYSRLTSSGDAVAGARISILAESGTELCSSATDANGRTSCFVPYESGLVESPRGTYSALFAGDDELPPAGAAGTMARACTNTAFPFVFGC